MGGYDQRFHDLLAEIAIGSEDAARDMVNRFGKAILRAIRRRMHHKLRTHFDSQDVMQEVLASFFCNPKSPSHFADPDALIRFLSVVARNKVVDKVRDRMMREKRNINRQYSLDGSAQWAAKIMSGSDPTPSQVVQKKEGWQNVREILTSQDNAILDLLAEGHSKLEISRRLGLKNTKVIRKVIEKVRQTKEFK